MKHYRVISNNLAGHQAGETVTDEDLAGANIAALIDGGHIHPTTKPKTQEEEGN